MTPFDQALKELSLTYAQIELIKQAVETFIIGPTDNPMVSLKRKVTDATGKKWREKVITEEWFDEEIDRNNKRILAMRQALRGTK